MRRLERVWLEASLVKKTVLVLPGSSIKLKLDDWPEEALWGDFLRF